MSAFLWVEDFEGGQYREFAFKLFGDAKKLSVDEINESEYELKLLLESKQIYLATTLAEGVKFISDESLLGKIDFVVLDIDLALMGPDISEDEPFIKPLLEKWYDYRTTDINEEESFNRACDELKRVAGYHLYIDLVVNRQFPRERVLFCSNHGGYLKAIQESFRGAKIDPPVVLTKSDPALSGVVSNYYADEYTNIRRIIVSICDELGAALQNNRAQFTLAEFLHHSEDAVLDNDGIDTISVLPLLLPKYSKDPAQISVIYRQFVRALTQDFDKVNYKEIPPRRRPYIRVLHALRNWTSHDSKSLCNLEVSDLAFIFFVYLKSGFTINIKSFDILLDRLCECMGVREEISNEQLVSAINDSASDICRRGCDLSGEVKTTFDSDTTYPGHKITLLMQNSCIAPDEHKQFMYRIFWHNILFLDRDDNIALGSTYLIKSTAMDQLTLRTFSKTFQRFDKVVIPA